MKSSAYKEVRGFVRICLGHVETKQLKRDGNIQASYGTYGTTFWRRDVVAPTFRCQYWHHHFLRRRERFAADTFCADTVLHRMFWPQMFWRRFIFFNILEFLSL